MQTSPLESIRALIGRENSDHASVRANTQSKLQTIGARLARVVADPETRTTLAIEIAEQMAVTPKGEAWEETSDRIAQAVLEALMQMAGERG